MPEWPRPGIGGWVGGALVWPVDLRVPVEEGGTGGDGGPFGLAGRLRGGAGGVRGRRCVQWSLGRCTADHRCAVSISARASSTESAISVAWPI